MTNPPIGPNSAEFAGIINYEDMLSRDTCYQRSCEKLPTNIIIVEEEIWEDHETSWFADGVACDDHTRQRLDILEEMSWCLSVKHRRLK